METFTKIMKELVCKFVRLKIEADFENIMSEIHWKFKKKM